MELASSLGASSPRSDDQIRVLSLNCWGLKYVSRDRAQRVRAIADELSKSDYDLIALQEVWVTSDYQTIRAEVSRVLPFAKFFHTGALGSGLAIFSRYPILESHTRPYALNGSPIDVVSGDWFVGKAAVSVVILHPLLNEVEVFNTHMYAKGGDDGPELQRAHRIVGAWELTKWVRQSAALGRHVIVAGDLNSIPTSLAIMLIRDHGCLTDAWTASHSCGLSPPANTVLSVEQAIQEFGITADSPLNSYTAHKSLDSTAKRWHGKRLDYLFYRGPLRMTAKPSTLTDNRTRLINGCSDDDQAPLSIDPALHCISSRVVLTSQIPGHDFSFSDHFGVEAVLEVRSSPAASSISPSLPEAPKVWGSVSVAPISHAYHDDLPARSASATGISPPGPNSSGGGRMSLPTIDLVLQNLAAAYHMSLLNARRHLGIFALCVAAEVLLIIGSAWQPFNAANPIFVLIGGVLAWLGTTMLYSGFIFGKWEVNTLMTAIEELELFRERVESE